MNKDIDKMSNRELRAEVRELRESVRDAWEVVRSLLPDDIQEKLQIDELD